MPDPGANTGDLTNPINEQVRTYLVDVGLIFHEHATALMMLLKALDPIVDAIGPNPFEGKGEPSADEVDELLAKPVTVLTRLLTRLIKSIEAEWRERGLDEDWWENLCKRHEQLLEYNNAIEPTSFRPPFLRETARELINLLSLAKAANLPQSNVNRIVGWASKVERLVCLYDLSRARSRIISMDQQAEALRDFLTKSKRPKEEPQVFRIRRLVEELILNLGAVAKEKRVELRFKGNQDDARVKAVERDVRGALTSILHNAIKYSWQMSGNQTAWVKILCYRSKGSILVAVENWGVPIHKDEIEQGLIFQMGYRGALSGDRGRLGTGLGLHDAWQTAREAGGDIIVTSEPSNDVYRQDPYKKAYITTVTFKLPIYKDKAAGEK